MVTKFDKLLQNGMTMRKHALDRCIKTEKNTKNSDGNIDNDNNKGNSNGTSGKNKNKNTKGDCNK